jgi:hypothetical protein
LLSPLIEKRALHVLKKQQEGSIAIGNTPQNLEANSKLQRRRIINMPREMEKIQTENEGSNQTIGSRGRYANKKTNLLDGNGSSEEKTR